MAGEAEEEFCEFCRTGRLKMGVEEIAFRQWSDKGHVHCRVQVPVSTCEQCGLKSIDPNCDEILDAAFRREYDKLP